MITVGRAAAARRGDVEPQPLPQWLQDAGFVLRPSQMSMIVAAPNVGKSAVALMVATSNPQLYTLIFSADTDPVTAYQRLVAATDGVPVNSVKLGSSQAHRRYPRLQWCFEASPTIDDIVAEIDCYTLLYGRHPQLIIVDNLTDIWIDTDDYHGLRAAVDELHQIARKTGAHVMVLHHAVGEYENGTQPIPLSGISNKLAKKPELVISLYRITDQWVDALGVCVIKNRNGPADRTAGQPKWLRVDFNRMGVVGEQVA